MANKISDLFIFKFNLLNLKMNKSLILMAIFASVSAVQIREEPFFTKESHAANEANSAHPSSTADDHARALAEEKAKADRIQHNADLDTDYHWNTYEINNPERKGGAPKK